MATPKNIKLIKSRAKDDNPHGVIMGLWNPGSTETAANRLTIIGIINKTVKIAEVLFIFLKG
jgi:hypothetical protein